MQAMLDKGIATRRGVMTAHNEKAYAKYKTVLPVTELMSNTSLILPLYIGMSESDQEFVITNLRELLK
jgi:dTDP-4-amino-4,6-dideoxygalactose transaminase